MKASQSIINHAVKIFLFWINYFQQKVESKCSDLKVCLHDYTFNFTWKWEEKKFVKEKEKKDKEKILSVKGEKKKRKESSRDAIKYSKNINEYGAEKLWKKIKNGRNFDQPLYLILISLFLQHLSMFLWNKFKIVVNEETKRRREREEKEITTRPLSKGDEVIFWVFLQFRVTIWEARKNNQT